MNAHPASTSLRSRWRDLVDCHKKLFMKKLLLLQTILLFVLLRAHTQTPYQPTRAEIMERYRKAHYLDSVATRSIFKATVRPRWSADGTSFWYRNFLKDSVKEYIFVDAVKGTRKVLDAEPADTIT